VPEAVSAGNDPPSSWSRGWTAAMGHEDAFLRPRLNARYRFGKGTLAGTRGNGRDAPKIGIGGHLTVPPLPHHRAYGSRTTAVRPGYAEAET